MQLWFPFHSLWLFYGLRFTRNTVDSYAVIPPHVTGLQTQDTGGETDYLLGLRKILFPSGMKVVKP